MNPNELPTIPNDIGNFLEDLSELDYTQLSHTNNSQFMSAQNFQNPLFH